MKVLHRITLGLLSLAAVGCQSKDGIVSSAGSPQANSSYLLNSEPAGAMPVGKARDESKDGEEITLVGRIGGSSKPFVEGLAAFTIVDPKVPYCPPD
jgi:hypothetical protein